VPGLPASPLPRPGRAPRAEAQDPARPVRRVTWLTRGGVAAAAGVGTAVGWGLGPAGLFVLFVFFVSGSLLGHLAEGRGPRRTARQVVANGGVAAVAALSGAWSVATGALAAATADTWATEIGSFSPFPPRLITIATRGSNAGMACATSRCGSLGAGDGSTTMA